MKSLKIRNFKSFEHEIINFKKLTVFAGENGAGKSTVLQTLLILKQSHDVHDISVSEMNKLYLNDYYCKLGTFKDIIYCESNEEFISFEITSNNDEKIELICTKNPTNEGQLIISGRIEDRFGEKKKFSFLDYILADFEFISADRFGPRNFYDISDNYAFKKVGKYGEFTAKLLSDLKIDTVFIEDLNNVLQKMFGFVEIRADYIHEVDLSYIQITNSKNKSLGFRKPINMPYGVSYVLPIIVSCLIRSKKHNYFKIGEENLLAKMMIDGKKIISKPTVIIENPEAHLHPKAQSELGSFLAQMAEEEVQIILETHSDHIINGIRKAVKQKIISHENVLFNFFEKSDEELGMNIIREIKLKEDGKLTEWPKGFFDQYDKDLRDINQ
ncbi:AAA family ATPase [Aliarcobacter butzleri]|uniref:AAA family ATPase n=1 Tax=Aliarcobacter butzleri TaxID=28197 RepID=UPI003B212AD3